MDVKYSIGIDSGSSTTKGVLFADNRIHSSLITLTGPNPRKTIGRIYNDLKDIIDSRDITTVTTGYGRKLLESANRNITEITCHAAGAFYLNPRISTIIDIGGQDSKVIDVASDGRVRDFLMNDKCAAGTGRFIEVIARLLEQDLDNLDSYVEGATPVKINSMCTVFAESEVVSLLAQDVPGKDIALGIVSSIAERTANFASRLHTSGDIFFSGGLSRFECFRSLLEVNLNTKVYTHEMGQYSGAIGAAIYGQ